MTNENPWDHISLAGRRAPGVVRFDSPKKPDGRGGFTMTLTIWTREQWAELDRLMPEFMPPPGPSPKMKKVAVEHPMMAIFGVEYIGVAGMRMPVVLKDEQGKETGAIDVAFECYLQRVGQFDGINL